MWGPAGYDGGHLIAATLHGFDERYDLVPQWASVKRGIYERMEAGAKDCLKARAATSCNYRIRVSYSDLTTLTPDTSTTDVQVDTEAHPAQSIQLTIPNRALDNSE
nr:DNA/RNA non-specific endonuclease [Actinomadura mexicana]